MKSVFYSLFCCSFLLVASTLGQPQDIKGYRRVLQAPVHLGRNQRSSLFWRLDLFRSGLVTRPMIVDDVT